MPNDAISREAAIAAVEDKFDLYGELISYTQVTAAIAAIPADTRWQELRAWLRDCKDRVEREELDPHGDKVMAGFLITLMEQQLDRLAPAPAGDQPNDVDSQKAQDVPKRPPMLLASIGDCSRDVWWTRQGEDLWESQRIFGVATHSSSAGLFVNRDHSDPEALRLYLEDMAGAQD